MRALAYVRALPLERLVAAVVAVHVFGVILAQTKVFSLLEIGQALRWVALGVLLGLSLLTLAARGVRVTRELVLPAGAALGLVALAFASAAWATVPEISGIYSLDNVSTSVVPKRAAAFALLLGAAVALAAAGAARAVAAGVLAGAAAVAIAGLAVLALDPPSALEPVSPQYPTRYTGLGGNPNAAAALEAVALPLALSLALAGAGRARIAGAAATALFAGSIVASGSRGAMLAAAAGSLVPALLQPRRRLLAGGLVAALVVAGLLVAQIPQPDPHAQPPPPPADRPPQPPGPPPNPLDAQLRRPLAEDVGRPDEPRPFQRTLLGSGGRVAAVAGAAGQALDRPLLGYGFGTEEHVFVDRYYVFTAQRPENAYVGAALQLGLVGVGVLLALVASLLALAARAPQSPLVAAAAGVVVAGLVLGVGQSFVFSAGSSAASAFWLCAFAIAPATASVANAR